MSNKLLTTSDAALLFGVTPRTIRAWVNDKKLIPDQLGDHGGNRPHGFKGETLRNYILEREGARLGEAIELEPADQLALARTEEVQLKNEITKRTLVNRAEFEADYMARLALVVSALKNLPDEIIALGREPERAEIERLINEALEHAYREAAGDGEE